MIHEAQLENARLSVLRYLSAVPENAKFANTTKAITQQLIGEGFGGATNADTDRILDYLRDRKLVDEVTKAISRENRAWRITADGVDYLATI